MNLHEWMVEDHILEPMNTKRMNSLDVYRHAGMTAGLAARRRDHALATFQMDWLKNALRMEPARLRASSQLAFDNAYRTAAKPQPTAVTVKARLERLLAAGFDASFVEPTGKAAMVRCTQCEAMTINGQACHERCCPNEVFECLGCNAPVERRGSYCGDCMP